MGNREWGIRNREWGMWNGNIKIGIYIAGQSVATLDVTQTFDYV